MLLTKEKNEQISSTKKKHVGVSVFIVIKVSGAFICHSMLKQQQKREKERERGPVDPMEGRKHTNTKGNGMRVIYNFYRHFTHAIHLCRGTLEIPPTVRAGNNALDMPCWSGIKHIWLDNISSSTKIEYFFCHYSTDWVPSPIMK